MVDILIISFVTLFVIIDPVGLSPMFAALMSGEDIRAKRRAARLSIIIATVILIAFAFLGEAILNSMGISLASFRIAGGILLFITALEMLFGFRTKRRSESADEAQSRTTHPKPDDDSQGDEGEKATTKASEAPAPASASVAVSSTSSASYENVDELAVFPLAIPLIAGPGSIATIIILMSQHQGDYYSQSLVILMLLCVLISTYILFLLSTYIENLLGKLGTKIITRLLGLMLAALSVQFVINGIKEVVAG